jgi:hypothetical protein
MELTPFFALNGSFHYKKIAKTFAIYVFPKYDDPLTETADIAAETKTVDKMPACVCRSGLRGKIP